jgi:hypothetical protein
MFKNNLILYICFFIFLPFNILLAQEQEKNDCRYAQVELGEKKHIALVRTETEMVDNFTTLEKGRVVDFSMVNSRGIVVLNIEVYKDAKNPLTPICIGSGASFTLKLQNGESVVLPQVGKRLCGFDLASAQEGFNNIKNRGSFLITEDKFESLKNSELISGSLKSADFDLYLVFNTDLFDDVNKKVNYPSSYFQRNLECVVNPTIIVQE